jgi:hypothetical protein
VAEYVDEAKMTAIWQLPQYIVALKTETGWEKLCSNIIKNI